jgi:hypothetical protein
MHDWILIDIQFDWAEAKAVCNFRFRERTDALIASGVIEMIVPRRNEWGRSVSVLTVLWPDPEEPAPKRLTIEMQSGDEIQILADQFSMRPKT